MQHGRGRIWLTALPSRCSVQSSRLSHETASQERRYKEQRLRCAAIGETSSGEGRAIAVSANWVSTPLTPNAEKMTWPITWLRPSLSFKFRFFRSTTQRPPADLQKWRNPSVTICKSGLLFLSIQGCRKHVGLSSRVLSSHFRLGLGAGAATPFLHI